MDNDIQHKDATGNLTQVQVVDHHAIRLLLSDLIEQVESGKLSKRTAVARFPIEYAEALLQPQFIINPDVRETAQKAYLTAGIGAVPGCAVGSIVLDRITAAHYLQDGTPYILLLDQSLPEDTHAVRASSAVINTRGGTTNHSVIIARQAGIPCVTGVSAIIIDLSARTISFGGKTLCEGDAISIDGKSGMIYAGAFPIQAADYGTETNLQLLLQWADEFKTIAVRANADSPDEIAQAMRFGATGVGVCRTEHMFLEPARLEIVRTLLLESQSSEIHVNVLKALENVQIEDFMSIFRVLNGAPITIRLLDAPFHEFLLNAHDAQNPVIAESNPMLGLRGVRLAIIQPDLYEYQIAAILLAAQRVRDDYGIPPNIEIMVPMVSMLSELEFVADLLERVHARTSDASPIKCQLGTMIELPRAALISGKLAQYADFFSFGTNDLTQTTFGLSRDDAEHRFLSDYLAGGKLQNNPFETLDEDGVGRLITLSIREGKAVKPQLKAGICGEHGGDLATIRFSIAHGLDYVSCAVPRIPAVRLIASQLAIRAHKAE